MKAPETGPAGKHRPRKKKPAGPQPQLPDLEFFMVSDLHGCHRFECSSILYFRAERNYTTICFTDRPEYKSTKNLGYFEKQLCPHQFIRICRSTIVNITKVTDYCCNNGKRQEKQEKQKRQVRLKNLNEPLEVSRMYSKELRRRLFELNPAAKP